MNTNNNGRANPANNGNGNGNGYGNSSGNTNGNHPNRNNANIPNVNANNGNNVNANNVNGNNGNNAPAIALRPVAPGEDAGAIGAELVATLRANRPGVNFQQLEIESVLRPDHRVVVAWTPVPA